MESSSRISFFSCAAGLLLSFTPALAQSAARSWAPPTSGFLYDSLQKGIRPVFGVVGSSYAGPVQIADVEWVSLAPDSRGALLRQAGILAWVPDLADPQRSTRLSIDAGPQAALWSADGSCAVLLAGEKLYWLDVANRDLRVHSFQDLNGTGWRLLAADRSSRTAFLAGPGSSAAIATRDLPLTLLESPSPAAAAVFSTSGDAVYLASQSGGMVSRLTGWDQQPLVTPLLMIEGEPSALLLSSDGARLFVADNASKSLLVFETATARAAGSLPLGITAHSTPLAQNRYWIAQRENPAQPFLVLDLTGPGEITFVPVEK